jgi:hypothetical protein
MRTIGNLDPLRGNPTRKTPAGQGLTKSSGPDCSFYKWFILAKFSLDTAGAKAPFPGIPFQLLTKSD